MDTPTSYYGTEAFARFKQMNEDVFRVESQARALGMEDARLALYRARIELGHEESRYRAQYAKDAAASLVQGTEATAGGGATDGVSEARTDHIRSVPGGAAFLRVAGNAGVMAVDPAQAFTEPGERRWSRVLVVLSEAMERAVRAFDTGTADDYGKACIAFHDAVAAELDRITSGVKGPDHG
jgi:hypothetical protein